MPEVIRVVDGSPRKYASCAAAPIRNPADGFEPMIGAAMIIFFPGSLSGGGLCRQSRMRSVRSYSCADCGEGVASCAHSIAVESSTHTNDTAERSANLA